MDWPALTSVDSATDNHPKIFNCKRYAIDFDYNIQSRLTIRIGRWKLELLWEINVDFFFFSFFIKLFTKQKKCTSNNVKVKTIILVYSTYFIPNISQSFQSIDGQYSWILTFIRLVNVIVSNICYILTMKLLHVMY